MESMGYSKVVKCYFMILNDKQIMFSPCTPTWSSPYFCHFYVHGLSVCFLYLLPILSLSILCESVHIQALWQSSSCCWYDPCSFHVPWPVLALSMDFLCPVLALFLGFLLPVLALFLACPCPVPDLPLACPAPVLGLFFPCPVLCPSLTFP